MMRLYGHLGWLDPETGEIAGGVTLCGQRRASRAATPLVTCGKCVAIAVAELARPSLALTYRTWTQPDVWIKEER